MTAGGGGTRLPGLLGRWTFRWRDEEEEEEAVPDVTVERVPSPIRVSVPLWSSTPASSRPWVRPTYFGPQHWQEEEEDWEESRL